MRPTSKKVFARLMVLKYVVVHSLATPRNLTPDIFSEWSEQERQKFEDNCRKQAESNIQGMKKLGLWKHASPKEKDFLQSFSSRMDEYAHKAASWRLECIGMLMWALGLLDTWPKIDEEMRPDILNSIPNDKVGTFSKHSNLIAQTEISSKRDLIEFWHWRVRTRLLIEEKHPFEQDEYMKRRGLNSFDDIVRFSARTGYQNGDLPEIIDEDFVFKGKSFRELAPDEYNIATSIIMERHFALNWLCGMAPGNRWDNTPTDT